MFWFFLFLSNVKVIFRSEQSLLLSMIYFSFYCSHGNLQHKLFFIGVDFFITIATPAQPILQHDRDQNTIENGDVTQSTKFNMTHGKLIFFISHFKFNFNNLTYIFIYNISLFPLFFYKLFRFVIYSMFWNTVEHFKHILSLGIKMIFGLLWLYCH